MKVRRPPTVATGIRRRTLIHAGVCAAGSGRRPYSERMIHGAVYEARPDVNAVIHHHACSVIPFSVTSTPLVPLRHTAAVIGAHIPVWDSADEFGDTDTLVRSMEIGRSLASAGRGWSRSRRRRSSLTNSTSRGIR